MTQTRTLLVLMILVALFVAACDRDDDDPSPANTPLPANTDAEVDLSLLGEGINSSQVERGLTTSGGLTVVSQSEFVRDGVLYLAYVVRNDSGEEVGLIRGAVTLVDEGDFVLEDFNIGGGASFIPPNGIAVIQGRYDVSEISRFDGLAVNIFADDTATQLDPTPYFVSVTGTVDNEAMMLSAQVEHPADTELRTLVSYFLVYDDEGELLNVIAGVPGEGLDGSAWPSGVTLGYTAMMPTLPDRDDLVIGDVQLVVYGYDYPTP